MIFLIMQYYQVPLWKTAPFIRLLPPLIAGIMVEWYTAVHISFMLAGFFSLIFLLFVFRFLPIGTRYRLHWLRGRYGWLSGVHYGLSLLLMLIVLFMAHLRNND